MLERIYERSRRARRDVNAMILTSRVRRYFWSLRASLEIVVVRTAARVTPSALRRRDGCRKVGGSGWVYMALRHGPYQRLLPSALAVLHVVSTSESKLVTSAS